MKPVLLLLFVAMLQSQSYSQYTQAFDFVLNPHSVSSFGSGWQGAASLSVDDALVYNPAKLTLNNDTKVSFFRNPNYMIGLQFPYTNVAVYKSIDKVGSFGISYENLDYGEIGITSIENPIAVEKVSMYERAISLAYAQKFNENLSAGIQLRYAYYHYDDKTVSETVLLSMGLLYQPEVLDNRLTLGFSLMNLGFRVMYSGTNYNSYSSPPSQLNMAANYIALENDFFTLPVDVSISKPFDEMNDDKEGQSSFKTLFTDWKDFPNDASLHTGISFLWKPLNLGKNFSYLQEYYIGNTSSGIKSNLVNYYTHGANIGINYKGIEFKMGYAGVFHNVHESPYFPWVFPYETFQFSLSLNENLFKGASASVKENAALENIIISAGAGTVLRTGRAKEYNLAKYENTAVFNIDAAFYLNKRNALVTSLYYNSVPVKVVYGSYVFLDSQFETFSFFSSYRYHIYELADELFIQGGLGIYRENMIKVNYYPKYSYKSILQLAAGYQFELLTPLVITPQVEYNNILTDGGSDAPGMEGRSQVNFMIKVGYSIF